MPGRAFFRLLIRLYPARFRGRFGQDMLVEFELGRRRQRTPRDLVVFWAMTSGIGSRPSRGPIGMS
jgi:hypothetical protein